MFFSKSNLAACGFASFASAHMLMSVPEPFSQPALQNGPLDPSGSNFPCQLQSGGSYSAGTASNSFSLGSSQPLEFVGQAVHGGGSCQVSITYDTAPTKDSVWKVIHSIEGGCPARGQTGNMGSDASAADPDTYNFTIPTDIPTGQVTLAWTWFNKIGNREMYMNCAPVTLTGTSGDKANFEALPDMFTANIGNGCGTVDSKDLLFPNPGDSVEQLNGATTAFAQPTGNCQAASGSSGSGSGASGSSAATAATTVATTAEATSATTSLAGGVFITVPTDGATTTAAASATSEAPATTAAVVTSAAVSSAAAATPSSASSSGSSSSSTSGTTTTEGAQTAGSACTEEGMWNCVGGSQFQQCASGTWSVVQSLAAGTSCTPGETTAMNIVASSGKTKRVAVRFRG
ncbi:Lytic polysaccharide monooxygenase [Pleurostoma richardsiae]|uniref:Lytic polysaccharide monooxygenase n=1 Tax=Pleurostoma richardsiae TaxID=41990 RepID=A0AA38RHF8_9PEZI|nr:Lytic polysaccharide monooxygenase [Pleurostoma richardsiae]